MTTPLDARRARTRLHDEREGPEAAAVLRGLRRGRALGRRALRPRGTGVGATAGEVATLYSSAPRATRDAAPVAATPCCHAARHGDPMRPFIVSGSAHPALAEDLARELEAELAPCVLERFPDGEQQVEVAATVRGQPVVLVQPLGPPVG